MKFNWGTGAFTLFGGFVVFMLGLVYIASQQSHELVTEDYYNKELEFKEVIKKQNQTRELSEQLQIHIEKDQLQINFPQEVGSKISGKLTFFKPSNQKDDGEIPFQITGYTYSVDLTTFSSGMYKLKVDWKAKDVEYYNEETIVIP